MARKPRFSFIVELDRLEGISIDELQAYLQGAIDVECKSFEPPGGADPDSPGDPMFYFREEAKPKVSRPTKSWMMNYFNARWGNMKEI